MFFIQLQHLVPYARVGLKYICSINKLDYDSILKGPLEEHLKTSDPQDDVSHLYLEHAYCLPCLRHLGATPIYIWFIYVLWKSLKK